MKDKEPVSKQSYSELQAKVKEYFSKLEELRGFL